MGSLCAFNRQSVGCLFTMRHAMIFSLCLVILAIRSGSAQTQPAPDRPPSITITQTERALNLSLEDAIRFALEHSLNVERERFSPQIEQTEIEKARAEFDPVIGLQGSLSQTKSLPTTAFAQTVLDADGNPVPDPDDPTNPLVEFVPSERFDKDGEVSLRFQHRIVTGGNYEISFENTRNNTAPTQTGVARGSRTIVDPRYESALQLTFTQPLLKGFGISVNRANINQARKTTEIAQQQLVQAILDVVFETQQAYWNLVFRMQDLVAKRESQKLAEDFLAENKVRVELGTMAPIELVQAETRVKQREGDVILAKADVEEAEDQLKEVLNIPETIGSWFIRIRPSDSPAFVPITAIPQQEKVAQALKNRPDYRQSQLQIDTLEIDRQVARNQLLPQLDFQAIGRLEAFGGDFTDSVTDLDETDGYFWLFGLRFEYPLGNRFARNELSKRSLEIKQAMVDQQNLKLTIVREIRQAIRAIETTSKRVEVTRATTVLAQTQLEAEQEKFRLGLSTSFVVLDFQEDLTIARSEEIQAISNYNIALARLDQITGTLRYGEVTEENIKAKENNKTKETP